MRDDSILNRGGRIIESPVNSYPNRLGDYGSQLVDSSVLTNSSPRSTVAQMPLPSSGLTSGPPPASINGPERGGSDGIQSGWTGKSSSPLGDSAVQAANKTNGFLWFMLLCSIGLNVYLSWIARGFYMRYAELAEELRETFTSTT
jgi:hypothetical protein